jgi:hypothetical protein
VPFRLNGPGSFYMVRPDSVSAETIIGEAYLTSTGQCFDWVFPDLEVVAEHSLTSTGLVVPPPSPWVGPLHLELP